MIALASDHAGFSYKEKIKGILNEMQLPFTDFGTHSNESTDYPDYGHAASVAISKGECDRGILVCGTGIGMSIVANKHAGVRAAVCETIEAAELSRKHNDANVLCTEQFLHPHACKVLDNVYIFAAAVIPFAGISLRILVRHDASRGFKDCLTDEILRCDQF